MGKILVVVAHPDDEVLGMGGTIARCVNDNNEVALLIVTDGSTAEYRKSDKINQILLQKKKETETAAEILGISKIFYGNLPDMKLDVTPHIEINSVIENVVSEFSPDAVFTHFSGDINSDHQRVFGSVLVACRPVPGQTVKRLYSFSVPSSTEWNAQNSGTVFTPDVFVDICGENAEKKYNAMAAYSTEVRDYPHPRSVEALRILDGATGLRVGLKSAEAFILHRMIL